MMMRLGADEIVAADGAGAVAFPDGLITQSINGAYPSKSLSDYQNVIVVDAGGNGDYTTQAAAAAAITDDDASHIYNVFVFGERANAALWQARTYIKVHGHNVRYKVYTALLNQIFTSAPVATVLENTFGSDPEWGRVDDSGNIYYTCTFANALSDNMFMVYPSIVANTGTAANTPLRYCRAYISTSNRIDLRIQLANLASSETGLTNFPFQVFELL